VVIKGIRLFFVLLGSQEPLSRPMQPPTLHSFQLQRRRLL
jgi:hypothetical protein